MTLDRYAGVVDDHEAFVEACDRPLPRTGRVNRVKSSFGEVRDALTDAGFGVERLGWFEDGFRIEEPDGAKVGNTLPHHLGWMAVQEEVSMLPPVVLGDAAGPSLGSALVLDVCAAPGSKTTQVAADAAGVVANDDNVGRIAALRNNTDRLGLTNVAVTSYDGRRFPGAQAFDAALVDVPCTSEGTVRKNPEHGEGTVPDDERASTVAVQKGILSRALGLVRDGGRVVYSTCTFAPEENEAVVDHAVRNGDARVLPFDTGLDASPGVTDWRGEVYADDVRRTRRYYPHQNDTGGFYVALLEPTTGDD